MTIFGGLRRSDALCELSFLYHYFFKGTILFKQYIHPIKSCDAIGTAQYISNGNGPLLPVFYELEINKYIHGKNKFKM